VCPIKNAVIVEVLSPSSVRFVPRRVRCEGEQPLRLALSAEILDRCLGFLDLFGELFDVHVVVRSAFADESPVVDDGFQCLVGLLTAGRTP